MLPLLPFLDSINLAGDIHIYDSCGEFLLTTDLHSYSGNNRRSLTGATRKEIEAYNLPDINSIEVIDDNEGVQMPVADVHVYLKARGND